MKIHFSRIMRLFKAKRLSDKIFGYTMLLYLAVVCAITGWLVFETYRSAKQGVYRELKLYENTFSKPLTDNLWSLDMMKLSSLVQGILRTHETRFDQHIIVEKQQIARAKCFDRQFSSSIAARGDTQIAGMMMHQDFRKCLAHRFGRPIL